MKAKKPKNTAGGLPAIQHAMADISQQAGLVRGISGLVKMNQKKGFDCPGCAWPDPDDRSMFEFCENGAKALAEEATQKKVGASFFQKNELKRLQKASDFWLGQQGRITEPLIKRENSDNYESIEWADAIPLIAAELLKLPFPDDAIFYTSGRTSNEAAYIYQLMVRLFGTNNLPDCSNMCHESSGVALVESVGFGKGSVTLEDFKHADCILVIGQNPGTNHPRMMTALQEARRNQAQIININPLFEAGSRSFKHPQEISGLIGSGTSLNTLHLPVRINGDVALLKGMMKVLLSPNFDFTPHSDFIANSTDHFESFKSDIENTPWSLIEKSSGISREEIEKSAQIFARSQRVIACWAMGLTQHKNAVANIQEVVNLLLLGGHMGRQGAGLCPVRGHSNVQGDRTMGIWERPSKEFIQRLENAYQLKFPRDHGLNVVQSIQKMKENEGQVFISLGGNFVSATPDTPITTQALENCRLTVSISTKLNRTHVFPGKTSLILPALGRSELDPSGDFMTVENSMGIVHKTQGHLKPISEQCRSEVQILCDLADELFRNHPEQHRCFPWKKAVTDYSLIRNDISQAIAGFENLEKELLQNDQYQLPHPIRDHLQFKTPSGRAQFTVHPIPTHDLAEQEFLMMTIRSHDQYNTTIYGEDDRYRGIYKGRKVVFIHPSDMEDLEIKKFESVDLVSRYRDRERKVHQFQAVPYEIPKGCIATYFPEANPLVPWNEYADKSHTPISKSVRVRVLKTDSL